MKREIKFRAWNEKEKSWVTGDAGMQGNDQIFLTEIKEDSGDYFIDKWDHITLMQFTGLEDKNGKEIYECDWLKDDQGDLFQVKFGKLPLDKRGDCVCTCPAFYAEARDRNMNNECNQIGEWMEVIGNIYQNPELLK
jgi:uncharacterized phage protein (TIGR01671 family)